MTNEDINKAAGELIKTAREDKGMTQELFAETVGITQQLLSKYERGQYRIPLFFAVKALFHLDIDAQHFFEDLYVYDLD